MKDKHYFRNTNMSITILIMSFFLNVENHPTTSLASIRSMCVNPVAFMYFIYYYLSILCTVYGNKQCLLYNQHKVIIQITIDKTTCSHDVWCYLYVTTPMGRWGAKGPQPSPVWVSLVGNKWSGEEWRCPPCNQIMGAWCCWQYSVKSSCLFRNSHFFLICKKVMHSFIQSNPIS